MLGFDRQGTGTPLLLLHGTNSSRSIWKPLLPQLSAKREVFSVDLPAHGQSPPSSFTPPEWAMEVAALLDHLSLERVAVVGHSSGGETWTDCGHMLMWDAPQQVIGAALALPTSDHAAASETSPDIAGTS